MEGQAERLFPKTVRFEYESQKGEACVLLFEAPTYRQRSEVLVAFKIASANWNDTELAKRIDGETKRRLEDWKKAKETAWKAKASIDSGAADVEEPPAEPEEVSYEDKQKLGAGCPAGDFHAENELRLVGLDQTIALAQQWIVDGEAIDITPKELQAGLARQSGAFAMETIGEACAVVFDLNVDKKEEAEADQKEGADNDGDSEPVGEAGTA